MRDQAAHLKYVYGRQAEILRTVFREKGYEKKNLSALRQVCEQN
jgi:hypothetical protein